MRLRGLFFRQLWAQSKRRKQASGRGEARLFSEISGGMQEILVDKASFLEAQKCRTKGWHARRKLAGELSRAELLRIRDGIKVGERAREFFTAGVLIDTSRGNLRLQVYDTKVHTNDSLVNAVFEATFIAGSCVAKADVIERDGNGWHLIEVKSGTKVKQNYIEDIAYTKSIMERSGFSVKRCSLMLISKDYRLGMPDEKLFRTVEVSQEADQTQRNFDPYFNCVVSDIVSDHCPDPELTLQCRNCKFWNDCFGGSGEHSILELPRLSAELFEKITSAGARVISEIKDESILSERQSVVWRSVVSQKPAIDHQVATEMLEMVKFPAKYLDFETAASLFPMYPGVRPYEQIPFQFSVHTCASPGKIVSHKEFLAETTHDCRLELANALLDALDGEGSIVVYSGFERRMITSLAKHLGPQLESPLLSLTNRLFDLEKVFSKAIYHPAFRGRTSIKYTSALVDLKYEGLDISDGQSAAAAFVMLARGEIEDAVEREKTRAQLLEYCALDSSAMVKLHQKVLELTG